MALCGNGLTWQNYGLGKLNAFADDKFNVAKMITGISVFNGLEHSVGKAENAGYQYFSPFPTKFSKTFFLRIV